MIGWMVLPFRRSFDFRGRSRRTEFAWFVALQLVVLVSALVAGFSIAPEDDKLDSLLGVPLLHVLVFGLPTIALQVRRMHDQDKSGWWVLVAAVPYLGAGMILYFMAQAGTWGANRFGPDPRHGGWEGELFE